MSEINNISKAIAEIVKESQNKGTEPYDTTAEVVRVEEGTAWVHIPGGVDETPAKMTVDASPGDNVQVRVADGRAWLTGNASAPPTDDTRANVAYSVAEGAGKAAGKAQDLAAEAQDAALQAEMEARAAIELIGDTPQYFWHEEEGTDTGSHITEIPKEEFQANPSGGNTFIRSTGVAIRQALTELALFMSNLIRLGPSNGKNVTIDTDSVDIMDSTTQLATFGATTRIGPSAGRNVSIGSSTVDVNNGSTNYASFGATTRIGEDTTSHITMSSSNMLMYDNENKETVRIQSGGNINVPMSEGFTVLSGHATASSFNYTTPVLKYTINWTNPVTLLINANYRWWVVAESSITQLTLTSASSTATATIKNTGGETICKITASCVGGNKIKLAFTDIDYDPMIETNLWDVSMTVGYQYASTYNYMRIKGNMPIIQFYNDLGTATSSIRAYNGGEKGNNLAIMAGGNMFIGGGEYAVNRYSYDLGESTTENSYFGADGTVYIESNGNTIANRKTWSFNTNGSVTFPNDRKGSMWFGSGIEAFTIGDGDNTETVAIWGNLTNYLAIKTTIHNGPDARFLVRYDSVGMHDQTQGSWMWRLTGLSGTMNLGAIGTVSQVSPSAVSVASGTVKNVASRSLAAGTWLVIGSAEFATNAAGRRAIQLATTTTGDAIQLTARDVQSPVSGAVTLCNFTTIVQPTATTTYYLNAYQNSGSALNVTPQLQCIRIK